MPITRYTKHKIKSFSTFLIIAGITMFILSFGPVVMSEVLYLIQKIKSQTYTLSKNTTEDTVQDSPFARLISTKTILLEPVDKDFGLVIERIGVNVPVVADVPVSDPKAYNEALKSGVAHASSSYYPSEDPGNVYMFAHASVNFWRLGKYATVFNLLRKLRLGDKIHVYYLGNVYIYEVVNKEMYKGWNTYPLTRTTLEPLLTLQTCDPPGTTINRFVVTARLIDVTSQ